MLGYTGWGIGFHLKFGEVFCIWDVQNLVNNKKNYLSAGEGLEPSTVGLSAEKFHQCHLKNWTTINDDPVLLKWPPFSGTRYVFRGAV